MLDDLYDPYGAFTSIPTVQNQALQPGQKQPLLPYTPQEEDSLLSQIGSKALGGLGYVGSVLEKATGGRAIRGLLGGKPRELLSIIPFSDMSGLTKEEDRVSGKELLGLQNEEGILPTIAGIGTEIALDPSTYLTFGGGALTKAGNVAKAAGLLPETIAGRAGKTLAEVLGSATPEIQSAAQAAASKLGTSVAELGGQRLGGVMGIGLPFSHPSAVLGASDAGVNFMNTLGSAANYVGHTSPLKYGWEPLQKYGLDPLQRYATAWFDPAVKDALTTQGQASARLGTNVEQETLANLLGKQAGYAQELKAGGAGAGRGADLRLAGEGIGPVGPMGPMQIAPAAESVAGKLRGDYESMLQEAQGLGIDVRQLADPEAKFLSRQSVPVGTEAAGGLGRPARVLQANDPRMLEREEILKNIPGGTEAINKMSIDQMISGPGRKLTDAGDAAEHIRANYLGMGPEQEARLQELRGMNLDQASQTAFISPQDRQMIAELQKEQGALESKVTQSKRLADYTGTLDPSRTTEEGNVVFGNNPLVDLGSYGKKYARSKGAAVATHDLLMNTIIRPGEALPADAVPIKQALEKAGLGLQVANTDVGGLSHLARKLNMSLDDVEKLHVPQQTMQEIERFQKGFSEPESVKGALGLFDQITRFTKAFQTGPWPSRYVRDFVSGLWNNVVKGAVEPGMDPINGFIKTGMDMANLRAGKGIADANLIPGLEHLTPEAASAAVGQEMYAHGVLGATGGRAERGVGSTLEDILAQIPGQKGKGFADVGQALKEGSWNPLKAWGEPGAADQVAPLKAGHELGDMVEDIPRGQLYLSLRRQGYTPEAAAEQVFNTHGDYRPSNFTAVEKYGVKRILPFYSFMKHNLPYNLEQVIQHPGGLVASEAKAAHSVREDQGGFLPDYLGGGLALPLGGEEGGMQRFLTRLDLPPESAAEFIQGGAHPIRDTAMYLLGQTNPLIKGSLEAATGKQFYSGRDLEDLHPTFGSMPGAQNIEQILMNSPLSKILTVGRTLADERKWESPSAALALPTNLLTGARVSDVDMEKAKTIAARDYITEKLRGQPEVSAFTTLSARPGMELTPEQVALLRLNKTLEQQAQKQKKIGVQKVSP